jgi:uncharacterized protein DUF4926
MIEELAMVRLKRAIPNIDIPVGSIGSVLMVHADNPPGYEVEFSDNEGNVLYDTKTDEFVFTLEDEDIEPISR